MVSAEVFHTSQETEPHRSFLPEFASYIPGSTIDNDEMASWEILSDRKEKDGTITYRTLTAEGIEKVTGIKRRHITTYETVASMATAAVATLDNPHEANILIVASSYPTGENLAKKVKKDLHLETSHELEVGAACSGFAYALTYLKENETKAKGKNIIVAATEDYAKSLVDFHPKKDKRKGKIKNTIAKDRSLAQSLFSAGAGAIQFTYGENLTVLDYTNKEWNKKQSSCLRMPIDRSKIRQPYLEVEVPPTKTGKFRQRGKKVLEAVSQSIPNLIDETITQAGLTPEDIALVIPHQGSGHIVSAIEKRLTRKNEAYEGKVMHAYENGNFSSVSIILALMQALEEGRVKMGDTIVLAGFGAGLFASVVVVKLGPAEASLKDAA